MEVIRNYDIARLVLGYLRDNKLDKAAKVFCKTSPYLTEEVKLLRKGYWPVSLQYDQLPEILREYCQIRSSVLQFVETLPDHEKPKKGTLLSRIQLLIKVAKGSLCAPVVDNRHATKRRKSLSEDTSTSVDATQEEDLPGYSAPVPKRRRVSSSFLCLSSRKAKHVCLSSEDESFEADLTASSKNSQHRASSPSQTNVVNTDGKAQPGVPIASFPEISEALLENVEFQNKLAETINKALSSISSIPSPETSLITKETSKPEKPSSDIATQFEEMIKNILSETENDPTFDELVENIVLSNSAIDDKPSTSNQSTQCSPHHPDTTTKTLPTSSENFETSIKDRLRPRKSNNASIDGAQKKDGTDTNFTTPCRAADNALNMRIANPSASSTSKSFALSTSDIMTTSTPLISDSLLAASGSQLLNHLSENIFIDMSTGQTIPFYMSNNIILDTSEAVGESLQLGKIIDSKNIETINIIPREGYRVPTAVSTNTNDQSLITLSITKCGDLARKSEPVVTEASIPAPITSTRALPATQTSSGVLPEKLTPNITAITHEMSKSLSTPRRRSSHIRVLNFATPYKSQSETKVDKSAYANATNAAPNVQAAALSIPQPTVTAAKPINAEKDALASIVNESSNSSCTNDFAKSSVDVTVIYQQIAETPKRKSEGRRSCARVLSKSESEDSEMKESPQKLHTPSKSVSAKKSTRKEKPLQEKSISLTKCEPVIPENAMEAWNRLRSISPGKWDQHLREVCAIEESANPGPPTTRKKKRKTAKKGSRDLPNEPDEGNSKCFEQILSQEVPVNSGKQSAKKALIEFKIATPLKVGKSPAKQKSKVNVTGDELHRQKSGSSSKKQPLNPINPGTLKEAKSNEKCPPPERAKMTQVLLETRTNNISLLLDTPFKVDATGIPITPGFLIPESNATPLLRMARNQISICKNPDIPTPNYAITPGIGLTPVDKDTPRSGHMSNYPTDYSSGSSYYKPDESEELDKRLDAILAKGRKVAKSKTSDLPESRDISQEESSNQTVITAIERTVETRVAVIECPKALEKIVAVANPSIPPHYTLREGIPTDEHEELSLSSESESSSSSSSSSSDSSDSSSESNHSDDDEDDDTSWVEPKEANLDTSSKTLLSEDGEVRYPIRNWITPKKTDQQSTGVEVNADKSIKKLNDVIVKIKNRVPPVHMKTKQIETLEEKRLRVKSKLKNDFAALEVKRTCPVAIRKPPTRFLPVATARSKKVPVVDSNQKCEQPKTPRQKIEVLTALNLSARSGLTEATASPVSDIFDGDAFPKLRMDEEDSKESIETAEVRKAAYVLTKLSKRNERNRSDAANQIHSETPKRPILQSVPIKPVLVSAKKMGRPRKINCTESVPSAVKVFLPQKPVTRGDRKLNETAKTTTETAGAVITVEGATKPTRQPSQGCDNIKETPTKVKKSTKNSTTVKPDRVESSSDQEDEDVDPYDECEFVSVNEQDPIRYKHITYVEKSNAAVKLPPPFTDDRNENLAASIMNIFINGAPHKIVAADETVLFTSAPSVVSSAKTIVRKENKRPVATLKRKPVEKRTSKAKSAKLQSEEPSKNDKLEFTMKPLKINIKYKQQPSAKDKNKMKTEVVREDDRKKSPTKAPSRDTNKKVDNNSSKVMPEATNSADSQTNEPPQAEAQAPIKADDILAVLSLIHGQ